MKIKRLHTVTYYSSSYILFRLRHRIFFVRLCPRPMLHGTGFSNFLHAVSFLNDEEYKLIFRTNLYVFVRIYGYSFLQNAYLISLWRHQFKHRCFFKNFSKINSLCFSKFSLEYSITFLKKKKKNTFYQQIKFISPFTAVTHCIKNISFKSFWF